MQSAGHIEPAQLLRFFAVIEPELYRFPAIDTAAFRREVEAFAARATQGD
jgi:hypothetical protein